MARDHDGPSETHLSEDGLWIPPALREFTGQVVFRTPAATIQHFQPDVGELGSYYPLISARNFGPVESFDDPQNPDLAPDRVSIKPQGEPRVELVVDTADGDGTFTEGSG